MRKPFIFDELLYVCTKLSSSSKSLNSILSYFTLNKLSARANLRLSFGSRFISFVITNLLGELAFFLLVDDIFEVLCLAVFYYVRCVRFVAEAWPNKSLLSVLFYKKRSLNLSCAKLLAKSTSCKFSLIFFIESSNWLVFSLY